MSTPLVCFVPVPQFTYSPKWRLTEKRKQEAERIRQKYPDRIPVSIRCAWNIFEPNNVSDLGYLRESRPNGYPDDRQEEVSRTLSRRAFPAHRAR